MHRPVSDFPTELTTYGLNFCYYPNKYHYNSPFLSEVIEFPNLVNQISNFLKTIPQENLSPIPLKKNIICEDIINPHTIPGIVLDFDLKSNLWTIPDKVPLELYTMHNLRHSNESILNSGKYSLIQNDSFLIAIRDLPTCVEMYIYKK